MKGGIKEAKKLLFTLHFILQRYSKKKLARKYQKKTFHDYKIKKTKK